MEINGEHHPENLQVFIEGQLDEAETNAIIDHLGGCDHCLQMVDALWTSRGLAGRDAAESGLDVVTAQRLEERLVRQIHRSELGGRALWLGTSGVVNTYLTMLPSYLETCLTLLRPLLTLGEPTKFDEDTKE